MLDPRQLDGIHKVPVKIAAGLEQAVIQLAKQWAKKPRRDRRGFMRALAKLVGVGVNKLRKAIRKVLGNSATLGSREAIKDIAIAADALKRMAPRPPLGLTGVTVRTPDELEAGLRDVVPGLMGSGTRLYDDILKRIAANPPKNDIDRQRIAQEALDDFSKRGVTAFIDKGGKRWNLVSYIEMATRTAANQAASEAYLNELVKAGHDVVRMSTAPNCSPMCQPFQGRLLSITGATRGTCHGETIVASVPEAIAAGFRHPNCRHVLKLWLPGDPVPDIPDPDPQAYKDSQTLRRYERELRQAKRELAAANTRESTGKAQQKIMRTKQKIRDHTASTGQQRNVHREQIHKSL